MLCRQSLVLISFQFLMGLPIQFPAHRWIADLQFFQVKELEVFRVIFK
jgi:hypothetical protein